MRLCYLRRMSLSRHALLAVLIAVGAAVASLAVWANGRVDLGFQLAEIDGEVRVVDVTPHGIAAREYWQPGMRVLELTAVDGRQIPTGIPHSVEGGGFVAPPEEAIAEQAVSTIGGGFEEPSDGSGYEYVFYAGYLDRAQYEYRLDASIWLPILGLGLGIAVWRLLAHGVAGRIGREGAVLFGAVVAIPMVIAPTTHAGTAIGVAAGLLVPVAGALVAGSWLARQHTDPAWRQTGQIAAALVAGLTVVFVVRFLSSEFLPRGDDGQIYALTAAIALIPAGMSAMGASQSLRERVTLLSLGLLPLVIGVSVLAPTYPTPFVPVLWVGALLGWHLLPVERIGRVLGRGYRRVAPAPAEPSVTWAVDESVRGRRDLIALAIGGFVGFIGLLGSDSWALIVGIAIGGVIGLAVRRGLLGDRWPQAAVPLGVAVAIPIMSGAFWTYDTYEVPALLAGIGGLPLAHLLAGRNGDAAWRNWLFIISVAFVGLAAFLVFVVRATVLEVFLLAIGVTVIPAIVNAVTHVPDGAPGRSTDRLEMLVVGVTPAIAVALLFAWQAAALALCVWLIVLFVWRRFTLAPLLGFVRRTQQQLDLAVAAAEQERARLAADLHDDALQELTGLVRRLDEAGDEEGAEMARGIAERLRGITSDLRLPLLDDLGAGPALEWLVGRVRPLAGGEVRLERSDPSRPPSAVELAVFRVAQEALANAVKHGKAPITVRYHVDEAGHVSLTVDDAGPGIDLEAAEGALASGHLGVANMQQRAEQIGALLNIRAWPTGGTHVGLEWRPQ